MPDASPYTQEAFMHWAQALGMNIKDESHMEELWAFFQAVAPNLKAVRGIDVAGAEPAMTYNPAGGVKE